MLSSSDMRAIAAARRQPRLRMPRRALRALTLLLALLALLAVGSVGAARLGTMRDALRYGYPRTTHLSGFLGHGEARGAPSELLAVNLNRQVVVIEFPGGDTTHPAVLTGPYLFGAQSDLTPVQMQLRDMDGDGAQDLVLDIADEWLVYLNKSGALRLPTPAEQRLLVERNQSERQPNAP